ncbi:MAG TPA: 7TM diverse intracellular signaling domain-containing protein [Oligoflexus sp.]|uniref:7TM diverse intracellular signaling domain-containing protein n=1 Tax=Oligoflexus sp. TaxID=1971216 RepID=UPI002D690CBB|nr:7TM diverse intracellular signaling domain-containing protein [Oligoflexus sp.]HYX37087.1 7TM diverse intracellular signaling domain-containing protein [Oligoflexus sp.]
MLDLRQWNADEHGTIAMEGAWDFYWGQLWTPQDFSQGRVQEEPLALTIPAVWNRMKIGDLALQANHFATYRAHIQLPENVVQHTTPLTLWMANLPGAYKLWLNGALVLESGRVGRDEKSEIPGNGSTFHTFVADRSTLDIVIQVSSFHHRDGGMWWPIKIGRADYITRVRAAGAALDGFALSCLFIMAFYHFGLWLMRPQYRTPLIFAMFCSFIAIRASVSGIGDLHIMVFPNMPQHVQKILEYAAFYLGVPAFYAFVRELYPEDFKTWLSRFLWSMGLAFALTTFVFPVRIFTDFIEYFQVITLFGCSIVCVQMWRAVKYRRDGISLLLIGTAILIFSSVNDILHAHRNAPIPTMVFPYGVFLMILCQSILLARRFSRAFHAVEVNEKQIQSLNAELQNQNAILDSLVEEKTRDIRSIMKNIKQGIFTVLGDGVRLGAEFSDHLRLMIGAPDLKGGEPIEKIFEQADLNGDRLHQIKMILCTAAGEDAIAFEMNAHLLPRELRLKRDHEQRLLELDWNAIENDHTGRIEKILVSLRDVTDLRVLQEESLRKQEELELIGEVLNVPTEKFDGLMLSCQKFLRDVLNQLHQKSSDTHRMFRSMHTIKGIARSYGLTHLAEAAHQAEEVFALLREGQAVSKEQLIQVGDHVGLYLERYDGIHRTKLGRKGLGSDVLMIDRSVLAENMESLRSLDLSHLSRDAQHRVDHLSRLFLTLVYMPLPKLLHALIADVPRLAEELGKDNPDIIIRDPGISIKHHAYDVFRNTFTHVLRNALDHGLETPVERRSLGKATRGRIIIELRLDETLLEIFVSDDGRGLDLAAIQRSARQRGLIASGAVLSEYEVANLIFAPGLSTKEQVTEISGRGVGLDAVKDFLEQYNGDIEIQLGPRSSVSEGVSFRFHITLPASVCELMQSVGVKGVASAS